MSAVHNFDTEAQVKAAMRAIGADARAAARRLANAPPAQKNRALTAAARILRQRAPDILAANARDLADGRAKGLTAAFLDRRLAEVLAIPKLRERIERLSPLRILSVAWRRFSAAG